MVSCDVISDISIAHKQGYQEGKVAARILSLFVSSGKKINGTVDWDTYKQVFIKSRADMAWAVVMISKSEGQAEVAGRFTSTLKPLRERAWSSVHSGFTEHLSQDLKTLFFALPER